MQFVTARGWEDLSNLMAVYEKLGFLVDEQVIQMCIRDRTDPETEPDG